MLEDELNLPVTPNNSARDAVSGASTEAPAKTPARRRATTTKKPAAGPPDSIPSAAGEPAGASSPPRKRAAKAVAASASGAVDAAAAPGDPQPAGGTAVKASARRGRKAASTEQPGLAGDSQASAGDSQAYAGEARPAGVPTVLFQAPQADLAPARPRRQRSQGSEAQAPSDDADHADHVASEAAAAGSEPADRDGRRRRRGGRGKRGHGDGGESPEHDEGGERADGASDADLAASAGDDDSEHDADGAGGSRRRRRRRRRGAGGELDEHAPDDPPNTVVRVREPREHDDRRAVQGVKGSTRLEAKKQRRREGREQIRRGRRGLVITEAEFLARRESVERVMVVRQRRDRTQIGVLEDGILVEHFVSTAAANRLVGNVYLGRVQNVLPGMEAAFVDIGKGRNAVLYAGEVNFDVTGLEGQPRRIEQALKPGQAVLVQVTKDAIGHKGARLTSQVSLPGRYLVYVPEGSMMGISRKLPDVERSRLKSILKQVMPEGAGVIVRTAAEGASEEELARDVARLSAQWEDIQKKAETASAPSLLYGEPDLTIRVIRDVFNEDFNSLIVQADSEWDTVEAYVGHVAPDLVPRLSRWTSDEDVFAHYRVEEQLAKALDRKVWLPSGGYLVIDRTEAMIVIDVNTGRFIGKGGNLEETVTKNNLEAAEEIVRQLRLRDVGGIIVIDFIDMVLESNRELVLRRLVECLGRDRTKHQVAEVTSLGLVQMTRKRVGNGLLEAFSEVCEHCNGRGVIVHTDPVEHKPQRGFTPKSNAPKPAPPRENGDKHPDAAESQTGEDASSNGGASGTAGGSRTRRGGRRRKHAALTPNGTESTAMESTATDSTATESTATEGAARSATEPTGVPATEPAADAVPEGV